VKPASPAQERRLVVVTCEHGGNAIPKRWAALFRGKEGVLRTHRGYDIGAARMAETLTPANATRLREVFQCPVVNHYSAWEVPQIAQWLARYVRPIE